jgi:hypothetical protein
MADNENTKPDAQAKPWGDDFDAERAWRLVQNLRAEVTDLKTERDSLKTERDQLQESTGSETAKVTAAEERAAKAEKALHVERALRKFPDLADVADLLEGDDEEAVMKKAERLSGIGRKPGSDDKGGDDKGGDKDGKKPDAAGNDADADNDGLPGKPKPDLKPGHGGDAPKPFDPAAIAAKAREASY